MKLIVLTAAFASALCLPAFAYLDPGTGSMVLQAIIAAVAVSGAALASFRHKIGSAFSSLTARLRRPPTGK